MILAFTGDPFLARRAARRAIAAEGVALSEVTEVGEAIDSEQVAQLASRSGLFGPVALLLDFGSAFTGQAGVKARDEAMRALGDVPPSAIVVVVDPEATPARQKRWAALGRQEHVPTPRYEALPRWVRREMDDAGLRYEADVPSVLAELFGEDPASVLSELNKLAVLDEVLTSERVRQVANRRAVKDAFDLVDAITAGDAPTAVSVARQLLDEGEAPQRVMGALAWQFVLLAKAVALLTDGRGRVAPAQAASVLKAKPFVASKAMRLAAGLSEDDVREAVGDLTAADVASKTGRDPGWALESVVIRLAGRFASKLSQPPHGSRRRPAPKSAERPR